MPSRSSARAIRCTCTLQPQFRRTRTPPGPRDGGAFPPRRAVHRAERPGRGERGPGRIRAGVPPRHRGPVEVDLTGQVCADSIGYRLYSGVGGQMDFIRGAALAPEGRAIIALPSTAAGGTSSRIVLGLREGAGVVTTRAHARTVVTEHGVARAVRPEHRGAGPGAYRRDPP